MPGRLQGRAAIVTGGAGGIGSATAALFGAEGARVAIVDLDPDALSRAAGEIARAGGGDAVAIAADITREDEAFRAVDEAAGAFGGLDILVNNAGVREYGPLAGRPASSWERIVAVNILGTASCTRAALPHLREAADGNIVNVSSTFGVIARTGMGQYDATKAAIVSMTRTVACEEAAHGVRANAVCPGGVLTPYHLERYAAQGIGRAELEEEQKSVPLMGRWAEAREIAYPILWLASAEASFVTAAALMVDGGKSAL
ncbi:MAG: SDR family NAD(P)-dependent oxidoreductase [Defluviicoccus sp.]|nr:SDR family NAD(P)-dependent oxidoreductase [Defluviicoccus sp.]MDE0386239.1 SDR family NAD(P)-dependent oxidoreductase [Defluviicoccus sp.]